MCDLFNIAGKKAIVTGGTRGLGYGMAEGLLEAGCEVCIVGTSDHVYAVAKDFCDKGYKCHGVKADLNDLEGIPACFAACMDKLGDLDIMVLSHGIQRRNTFENFTVTDWNDVMNVNLNSVFLMSQEAVRIMLPKNYGKIIIVSSMAAYFGCSNIPAYAASKGGVTQLAKAMGNDLAGRGINVNCLAPGHMATDMCAALSISDNPRSKQILARTPKGRLGTGEDMKGPCIFLASHASDYLSGAVIPVDGGYLTM